MKEDLELPKNALLIGVLSYKPEASVLDLLNLYDSITKRFGYVGTNLSIHPYDKSIFNCNKNGIFTLRKGINKSEYLKGIRDQITNTKLLKNFDRATKKFARQI